MQHRRKKELIIDLSLAAACFGVLLLYTYNFFFMIPYMGLEVLYQQVTSVHSTTNNRDVILPGDIIQKVDDEDWTDKKTKVYQPVFLSYQSGDRVHFTILRGDQLREVEWIVPGLNRFGFFSRLSSYWYLAYFFWGFGLLTALLVRPRDQRWKTLVAFDYIMALWLAIGATSNGGFMLSMVFMRGLSWILLAVSLHLHWIFPQSLSPPKSYFTVALYTICGALAVVELLGWFPFNAYWIALFLFIAGSLVLLIRQVRIHPQQRSQIRLLAFVLTIIMLAIIISLILYFAFRVTQPAGLIVLLLPLLPMVYFYIIASRRLRGMEVRLNRLISLVVFFAIIFLPAIMLIFSANLWLSDTGSLVMVTVLVTMLAGLSGVLLYPPFQRWFDLRILRVPEPPKDLLSNVAARLATSLDMTSLVTMLRDEVFPGLLVRQAALLRLFPVPGGDSVWQMQEIFRLGVPAEGLPAQNSLTALLPQAGKRSKFLPSTGDHSPAETWVRLVLSLMIEDHLVGLCLLGRRDPDDYYSPGEVSLLEALMDQTALALVHIEQTSRLHAFFQADIERQEEERSRLARDLHDQVLGQMAVFLQSSDDSPENEKYIQAYQSTVRTLREMIYELRPVALNYGLRAALEDLGDEMDRLITSHPKSPQILIKITGDSQRYPPDVELHFYRIVQQACRNALEHAQATAITIDACFTEDEAGVEVQDNGVGFDLHHPSDLADLLENGNFGLVGMVERAELIQASLNIASTPGHGTRVHVRWGSPLAQPGR